MAACGWNWAGNARSCRRTPRRWVRPVPRWPTPCCVPAAVRCDQLHGGSPAKPGGGLRSVAPDDYDRPVSSTEAPGPDGIERALVVMAHPDDVDFGAAGTIATWTDAGIDV